MERYGLTFESEARCLNDAAGKDAVRSDSYFPLSHTGTEYAGDGGSSGICYWDADVIPRPAARSRNKTAELKTTTVAALRRPPLQLFHPRNPAPEFEYCCQSFRHLLVL